MEALPIQLNVLEQLNKFLTKSMDYPKEHHSKTTTWSSQVILPLEPILSLLLQLMLLTPQLLKLFNYQLLKIILAWILILGGPPVQVEAHQANLDRAQQSIQDYLKF